MTDNTNADNPDDFDNGPPEPPAPAYPGGGNADGPKRLVRRSSDKWLGGVCGGVADYLGIDANLVRLLAVLGAVLGLGSLIVVYVIAWVLIPRD